LATSTCLSSLPRLYPIFYKDWGDPAGKPVVFSHGWPLNSDNWENQMFFLANHVTAALRTIDAVTAVQASLGLEMTWILMQ